MPDLTEWEKMTTGALYSARDPYLAQLSAHAREVTRRFNEAAENRSDLLAQLFGGVGKDFYIERNFYCDYGRNIYVGDCFYANTGLVILDECAVRFGDNVMIGPQVGIYAATHPLDWRVRRAGLENGKPITVGDDVWIGGHAVINPGVTIGSRVVIGSGAVVTRDVPDDVAVAGNPARIIKRL